MIIANTETLIPVQVAAAGEQAAIRFIEFFTANIRNPNTRAAYARAVSDFFRWCEGRGLHRLNAVRPVHVAGYVEEIGKTRAAPSVKQSLAAVAGCSYNWLVVGQVVRLNPASVVRGPKHVIKRGKIPILSPEEARELFDGIPTDTLVGLRDRALIGVLIYSFREGQRRGVDGNRYENGTALVAAYSPRLKRIGIQNWRRASTVAGMSRQAFDAQRGVARALQCQQRRELVRRPLPGARLRGLLVAFRPTQLHHRRPQRPPLRLQSTRRPAVRGHRSIETTERYIDSDTSAQRRLVGHV